MERRRLPPDPVAVLRGHCSSVMDVCFHHSLSPLLRGFRRRAADVGQRPTSHPGFHLACICVSSSYCYHCLLLAFDAWSGTVWCRAHAGPSGVLSVGTSPSLDKQSRKGRDGTVKCWDVERGDFRKPLVTFKISSYHFCKLSLAKVSKGLAEDGHRFLLDPSRRGLDSTILESDVHKDDNPGQLPALVPEGFLKILS